MTPFLSAFAVFLLGLVAIEKWRREEIGKFRLELAIRISADCEEFRQIVIAARSAINLDRVTSRVANGLETEKQKIVRDAYFSVSEELNEADQIVEQLRKDSFQARVLFGVGIFEMLGDMFTFRRRILRATSELIKRTGPEGENIDDPFTAEMLPYVGGLTRGDDGKPDRGEALVADFVRSVDRVQEILAAELDLEAARTIKIVRDMFLEILSPVRWIRRQVLRFYRWYAGPSSS